MTDWGAATKKAQKTAKWATTMTKWLITKAGCEPRWQLVAFAGPQGRESRGIVDLIAVRKDHRSDRAGLKRGDLFDVVLIQIKGGSARWPSLDDARRLAIVRRYYHARAVVLADWKRGKQPTLYRLKRAVPPDGDRKSAWSLVDAPADVFD